MRVGMDYAIPQEPYDSIWQILQKNAPCLNISLIPPDMWRGFNESLVQSLIHSGSIDSLHSLWVITDQRDELVNFSRFIFQSGLTLVVPDAKSSSHSWITLKFTMSVFSPSLWAVVGVMISLIVVGHLISANSDLFPPHYLPSVWRWFAFYIQGNAYNESRPQQSSPGYGTIAVKLIGLVTSLFTIHSLQLYQVSLRLLFTGLTLSLHSVTVLFNLYSK